MFITSTVAMSTFFFLSVYYPIFKNLDIMTQTLQSLLILIIVKVSIDFSEQTDHPISEQITKERNTSMASTNDLMNKSIHSEDEIK